MDQGELIEPAAGLKMMPTRRAFFSRHERLVSFIAFIAGFIFDGLTLTHVNLHEAAVILGSYLIVIAIGIIVFNAVGVRHVENRFVLWLARIIPYVIQFMFGTLLNASFIFYTTSAQLSISWPFILFLALIVLVNEIFHKRHQVLTFQVAIFFVATFLYMAFAVPLYSGKIGDDMFLLSGSLSVSALVILGAVLSAVAKPRFNERRRTRIVIIALMYVLINFAYFKNIIPPIPLALKDVGVYHSIIKIGNNYSATYEQGTSYMFWRREGLVYHALPGESVYVFSAVFAPSKLAVPIYHEWFRYDELRKAWVLEKRISFSIVGGRDGGYRVYSLRSNITEGKWRVDVTAGSNEHLGSVSFEVTSVKWPPVLSERTL